MSDPAGVVDPQDEAVVRFLNVDVDLYGGFAVLSEGGDSGCPDIAFELNGADARTLAGTLAELTALVRALPDQRRLFLPTGKNG